MDTQEAYAELGLQPTATDAQLKAAWRRLVAAWHPDRNASADAGRRMQLINKAYQHIRQLRDGELEESEEDGADVAERADGDAAEESAATGKTKSKADAGGHAKTHFRKVRLTMEDAVLGCTRSLKGHFTQTCGTCVGKGQRVLAQACNTCKGSGAVRKPALFGWIWNDEPCVDCGGDGRQRAACDDCEGTGERQIAYRRQVRFPAGVRDGQVLSLPTSRHGDVEIGLELELEIEPHPFFTLDADGILRCEMPVNGYAWMAGRWVDVPTPDGVQQMRLNRDALIYRLRNQGFPSVPRGPRGDYLVKVTPVFPAKDDAAQDALLDQLIAASTKNLSADRTQPLGDWQRRMKRWTSGKKDASSGH